jgi:hypothetical protein
MKQRRYPGQVRIRRHDEVLENLGDAPSTVGWSSCNRIGGERRYRLANAINDRAIGVEETVPMSALRDGRSHGHGLKNDE